MVGQLAYSLMPWRISASASTLTLANSCTPQALRTCTASCEKPHCGNCGVPFMKRTTRLPVTCSLMRCWVSMAAILSPSTRDPGDAGQIGPRADFFKPRLCQEGSDRPVLPLPVLDEEPTACGQIV